MSIARATASSEVSSPRMISTSCILSTGEKKCSPMKSLGRVAKPWRLVIGRVEVLEQSRVFGPTTASTSAKTFFFRS